MQGRRVLSFFLTKKKLASACGQRGGDVPVHCLSLQGVEEVQQPLQRSHAREEVDGTVVFSVGRRGISLRPVEDFAEVVIAASYLDQIQVIGVLRCDLGGSRWG